MQKQSHISQEEFADLLRDALLHLYDPAYLQTHALSPLLLDEEQQKRSGMTLYRLLVESIEQLRPHEKAGAAAPAWRPYWALHFRYIEGLSAGRAAEEMAISPRQFRREHHKALAALADFLWAAHIETQPATPAADSASTDAGVHALENELNRLGTNSAATPGSTSLPATLHGILQTLTELAARKQIHFDISLPPTLPDVYVERVVLRQILLNVLTFCLDVESRGTVRLAANVADGPLRFVAACTPGAAHTPATPEHERIAVVERLIALQGGRVALQENAGELTISLTLPVRRSPAVLIIDDNPDVIQLFRRYLSDRECRVVGEPDSRLAVQRAREIRPSVIVLDVMMPGQDGWEILQHLQQDPATAGIPVVVCSVLREQALARSLGAAGFLAKPVNQQALLACVAPYISPSASG